MQLAVVDHADSLALAAGNCLGRHKANLGADTKHCTHSLLKLSFLSLVDRNDIRELLGSHLDLDFKGIGIVDSVNLDLVVGGVAFLEKHGKARAELVEGLKSIPYLRVFPSQANFIMCEVTGGRTSLDLCAQILVNEDILIKDLSSKAGNGRQYIRIAVRDEADNARLIEALKRA